MSERSRLSRSIASLSRYTFIAFIIELFSKDSNYEPLYPLPEAGEDVFCQPLLDSYGGSIHSVLLLHSPPLELFDPSELLSLNDPTLITRLGKIKNMYHRRTGQWGMVSPHLRKGNALNSIKFITNLFGIERGTYDDILIPTYARLLESLGLRESNMFIGSCDSFVDLNPEGARRAHEKVMDRYREGVAVSVSEHNVSIQDFVGQRSLSSGVSAGSRSAYESIMVSAAVRRRAVLFEFEKLIKADVSEKTLEDFLVAHFQELFGSQYDRVESQLWLRFPELDIGNRRRRIDLFLRNSIKNDWELFEIKRPIPLTGTYRDVPVFAKEVLNAMHQVRNYGRILKQDKVKRHFAAEGIDYYEPVLHLVIGRRPQIPHDQWRWLETENAERVLIFTFDDLLAELRQRLEDHYNNLCELLDAEE